MTTINLRIIALVCFRGAFGAAQAADDDDNGAYKCFSDLFSSHLEIVPAETGSEYIARESPAVYTELSPLSAKRLESAKETSEEIFPSEWALHGELDVDYPRSSTPWSVLRTPTPVQYGEPDRSPFSQGQLTTPPGTTSPLDTASNSLATPPPPTYYTNPSLLTIYRNAFDSIPPYHVIPSPDLVYDLVSTPTAQNVNPEMEVVTTAP